MFINKILAFCSPWSAFRVLIIFFTLILLVSFHLSIFLSFCQELPVICLGYCPSTKQHFSPNVCLLHLRNELHCSMHPFKCTGKIITCLSYPRLVIWINVSLIKLAAGLSVRNITIRSQGTRTQKTVPFQQQHLLPPSLIRRNGACRGLPTQCWLLIKCHSMWEQKKIRKQM